MQFNINIDKLGYALHDAGISPISLTQIDANTCEFEDDTYNQLTVEQKQQIETIINNLATK